MSLRLQSTICILSFASAACSLNSPMPQAPITDASSMQKKTIATAVAGPNQYQVQRGDTLYSIGRKFGIPHLKLAELNRLQSPYEIHIGQILNLGTSSNPANTSTPTSNKSNGDEAEVVTNAISNPAITVSDSAHVANAGVTANESQTASASSSTLDIENIADGDIHWQWPLNGKVITNFDPVNNKGLNIAVLPGQTIHAAGAGKVIYSGMDVRGNGKLIIIKHNNNLLSVYAHQGNSLVKEGTYVNQGDKLATLPESAASTSGMLHFEIRQKGKPVDPNGFLPANTNS